MSWNLCTRVYASVLFQGQPRLSFFLSIRGEDTWRVVDIKHNYHTGAYVFEPRLSDTHIGNTTVTLRIFCTENNEPNESRSPNDGLHFFPRERPDPSRMSLSILLLSLVVHWRAYKRIEKLFENYFGISPRDIRRVSSLIFIRKACE